MKQYSFNVNGQSAIGNLIWNTNGSMQQLAITDPFNSPDTQTCTYTHDDLGRVSATTCPGIWSQTFTYDPFGNVTKSGNSSWLPGYDTNNHYTLGGTSYDANGNLKNDTLNAYTWNADTTPATINSAVITSDALGRTVEVQNGTSGPWLRSLIPLLAGRRSLAWRARVSGWASCHCPEVQPRSTLPCPSENSS